MREERLRELIREEIEAAIHRPAPECVGLIATWNAWSQKVGPRADVALVQTRNPKQRRRSQNG